MNNTTAKVKGLGSLAALRANTTLAPYANALGPLLENGSLKPRRKISTLGEGTFGRVNLERFGNGSGNVATKYLTGDPNEEQEDIVREIAALRYLRGLPHVAQLVGVVPPNRGQAFPAPMLEKAMMSLQDYRFRSWDDTFNIARQVLYGYYVLHSRGITHCDTKPANMLITAWGEVQISDFGMSKYITHDTPNDLYTGTRIYSSPEILMMNILVDRRPINWFASDIWAVGTVLYYIFTGRYFVRDDSSIESTIKGIFTILGTPIAGDGIMYDMFDKYKTRTGNNMNIRKVSIKELFMTNTRYKPGDDTVLDGMATLITMMLDFDPTKRPTMKGLLDLPIMGGAPVLPFEHRPALTPIPEYYVFPPELNIAMYKIVTDWLYQVQCYLEPIDLKNVTQSMIILDRTYMYILKILDMAKKKAHPSLTKRNKLHLVSCIALYISSFLYQRYGYNMSDMTNIMENIYTIDEGFQFLYEILSWDIQYYGKTIYDELLDIETHPMRRWKLGILNLVCYQNEFYTKYPVEEVKRLMLEHEVLIKKDPRTITKIDKNVDAFVKPFIDAVKALPTSGGGRRHKNTRRKINRNKRKNTYRRR